MCYLLFISTNGDMRRRSEFPSFAWAGWEGTVMWPRENFVRYEDKHQGVWRRENIYHYLTNDRLVSWGALDASAHHEDLSWNEPGEPSPLLQLMREYPGVFPNADEDLSKMCRNSPYSSSSGLHADVGRRRMLSELPKDSVHCGAEGEGAQSKRGFSIKTFDLANGQVEFDRLLENIRDTRERRTLQNWMAVRSTRRCFSSWSISIFSN